MSLRASLVHHCFSQNLNEPRPAKCRCRYRVTTEQAKKLVEEGLASYLIVDWKTDSAGQSVPVTSWNLVWGSKQEDSVEDLEKVRSAFALKTPRVMTLEKANLERAFISGNQDEIARIQVYGELSEQVILDLTTTYWPELKDPFKGRVLFPFGVDQRTCPGKNTNNETET